MFSELMLLLNATIYMLSSYIGILFSSVVTENTGD